MKLLELFEKCVALQERLLAGTEPVPEEMIRNRIFSKGNHSNYGCHTIGAVITNNNFFTYWQDGPRISEMERTRSNLESQILEDIMQRVYLKYFDQFIYDGQPETNERRYEAFKQCVTYCKVNNL